MGSFNQGKALVGAFSVITNLRMELFEALVGILYSDSAHHLAVQAGGGRRENHLICIFILHWTFKGFRDLV